MSEQHFPPIEQPVLVAPQPEPQEQVHRHIMETQVVHKNEHHGMGRSLVKYGSIAVAAVVAFEAVRGGFGWNISIPNPFKEHPTHAQAAVDHTTLKGVPITYQCSAEMSEYVGVKAKQEFTYGSESVDKKYLGRYEFCGDDKKLVATGDITKDPQTGKVLSVVATMPETVAVVAPRIDYLDVANCAPLRSGDNQDKIDQKIAKQQKQIKDGKSPKCDTGAHTNYGSILGFGSTGVAIDPKNDAPQAAATTAQLALALDPYLTNQPQITAAETKLQADMTTYIKGYYHTDNVILKPAAELPVDQVMEQRVAALAPNMKGIFETFVFSKKDGKLHVHATEHNGATSDVDMTDTGISQQQLDGMNQNAKQLLGV